MPFLSNRFCQISGKIIVGILAVLLLGMPIVETGKMFVLLAGILILIHSGIIFEKRRLLWGMGIVVPILIIKSILPVAGIEEGHNIFLYLKEGEALQRSLPAAVFNDWRKEFDKTYPPVNPPYENNTWRDDASKGALPDRTYAHSSDALWRSAKYSRKVDSISFTCLAEFRGGFANELKYNWWQGIPDRRKMPFFTMYEFSQRSVGCELFWRGVLFWEKPDGSYEKIIHPALSGKKISSADVGRKAYLFFLPEKTPVFPVFLRLNRTLAASRIGGHILSVLGILCLYVLMIRPRWRPLLIATAIVAISMILIYLSIAFSGGKPLGSYYTPHGGGDDGLLHESYGRQMAKALMVGNIGEALEGCEPAYWFTPGMRYFRALEKIVFGDTNLGLTAFLSCLPWFVFLFVQRLCNTKWACLATFIFLFSPVSFSFAQYIVCGLLGYAEPSGSGLFLLGFFLFLKSQPRWGGQVSAWSAFIGGACLAGAVFLRPNYAIAAVLLGTFFLYGALRDRHFRILVPAFVGLSLAFLMPIHNLYFGDQFYLISKSGATVSVTLSPMTYLHALGEWLTGHWQGTHLSPAIYQVKGWLWTPPVSQFPLHRGISLFLLLRLLTFFITLYALFISPKRIPCLALLAWVALAAHLPMLFVFATPLRYDLLGWDLSMIVTIMLAAHTIRHYSFPLPGKGGTAAGNI
ncbi:MAG: hypothetical protein HY742_04680 [Deltaproteobacteria bacterium]|nr:hypothetical protein [Deltaproteobacteria bacterium]